MRINSETEKRMYIYAYNPIRVIHKKTADEYKKLVVKTKFSLERIPDYYLLLSGPIMTLGSPLYIPVPSLNFFLITDIRCTVYARLADLLRSLSMFREQLRA